MNLPTRRSAKAWLTELRRLRRVVAEQGFRIECAALPALDRVPGADFHATLLRDALGFVELFVAAPAPTWEPTLAEVEETFIDLERCVLVE